MAGIGVGLQYAIAKMLMMGADAGAILQNIAVIATRCNQADWKPTSLIPVFDQAIYWIKKFMS